MIQVLPLKRYVDPARPITYGIVQAGEDVDGGVPYIRPIDMDGNNGIPDVTTLRRTTPEIAKTYRRSEVRPGDLIVSIGPSFGKTMIVPEALAGANLTQGTARVAPAKGVSVEYLYWALQSQLAKVHWHEAVGGATFRALNLEPLAETPVPLHPENAQRAITRFLSAETARIDTLVSAKRRMVKALEARWQSIMHHGVAGLLTGETARRPTSVPWLSDVPKHWREAKVTLLARLGSGHTPSRQHPAWWENPSIPWITTGEVSQMRADRIEYLLETREMISEAGLANSAATLHPAGTVVLCRTASAGYSAIMGREMATSQDFATWTCGPLLRPRFLLLCLRVMRQDLLGRLAMGSTHQTIYMPDIESIRIPLPGTQEQDAIVDAVYTRLPAGDAAIDKLDRQIALLRERREALITAAVSGEFPISKPENEAN